MTHTASGGFEGMVTGADQPAKRKAGRPKKANGLRKPTQEKRQTLIVQQDHVDYLKALAGHLQVNLKDVVAQAFECYLLANKHALGEAMHAHRSKGRAAKKRVKKKAKR